MKAKQVRASRWKSLTSRSARSAAALSILCVLAVTLWGPYQNWSLASSLGQANSADADLRVESSATGAPLRDFLHLKSAATGTVSTDKSSAVSGEKPSVDQQDQRSSTAPSSRGPRQEQQLTFQESFILSAVGPAQGSQRETKVPASVTIAQAILESDWGRSGLTKEANNYFGIKARPEPGPAGVVYKDTWEVVNGANVMMNEPFRAYHNMEESFIDHGQFFVTRPRYAAAFNYPNDPRQFAREIHKAGYATDPGYSGKLIGLMDKYDLYAYDLG